MSESIYDVVFTGKLVTGIDTDVVARNLSNTFNIDVDKAKQLIAKPGHTIKKSIIHSEAEKYLAACNATGAIYEIRVIQHAQSPEPESIDHDLPQPIRQLEIIIKNNSIDGQVGRACFALNQIPQEKSDGARQAYATLKHPDEIILFLQDDTTFGSAKEGIVLTNYRLIGKGQGPIVAIPKKIDIDILDAKAISFDKGPLGSTIISIDGKKVIKIFQIDGVERDRAAIVINKMLPILDQFTPDIMSKLNTDAQSVPTQAALNTPVSSTSTTPNDNTGQDNVRLDQTEGVPPNQEMPVVEQEEQAGSTGGLTAWIGIGFILAAVIMFIINLSHPGSVKNAGNIIKQYLVSPDSFSIVDSEVKWQGKSSGRDAYIVKVIYDADNAYGTKVRECKMVAYSSDGEQIYFTRYAVDGCQSPVTGTEDHMVKMMKASHFDQ